MADRQMDGYENCICPVCSKLYVDPVLLKCYHTLCKNCVYHVVKGKFIKQIICPVCKAEYECDIDRMESNIYINAVLAFHNSNRKKCEICENHEDINWKCLKCNQYMCLSCKDVHSKFKTTKYLEVVERDSVDQKLTLLKDLYCQTHKDEVSRFICIECNIPVCRDCKHTVHEGHKSRDIAEIAEDVKKWGTSCIKNLQKQQNHYQCYLRSCSHWDHITALTEAHSLKQVDKIERHLQETISKVCTEVRNTISNKSKESAVNIEQFRTEVDSKIAGFNSKKSYLEQVISMQSAAALAQCRFDIETFKTEIKESLNLPDYHIIKIQQIPDLFKLPSDPLTIKQGIHIIQKSQFRCVDGLNKVVTGICLPTENKGFIALRNINVNVTSILQKMVHSYDRNGNLIDIYTLPQQLDITLDKCNRLLWYDEKHRQLLSLPHSENREKNSEPLYKNICRPIAISQDVESGDVVVFDSNQELKRNFSQSIDISCLGSPMYLSCFHNEIWVTDPGKGQVVVFDKTGKVKFTFNASDYLDLPENFCPHGICHSYKHNCAFVSDTNNHCVVVIDGHGDSCFILIDKEQDLKNPTCLASKDDALWVCDQDTRITVYQI